MNGNEDIISAVAVESSTGSAEKRMAPEDPGIAEALPPAKKIKAEEPLETHEEISPPSDPVILDESIVTVTVETFKTEDNKEDQETSHDVAGENSMGTPASSDVIVKHENGHGNTITETSYLSSNAEYLATESSSVQPESTAPVASIQTDSAETPGMGNTDTGVAPIGTASDAILKTSVNAPEKPDDAAAKQASVDGSVVEPSKLEIDTTNAVPVGATVEAAQPTVLNVDSSGLEGKGIEDDEEEDLFGDADDESQPSNKETVVSETESVDEAPAPPLAIAIEETAVDKTEPVVPKEEDSTNKQEAIPPPTASVKTETDLRTEEADASSAEQVGIPSTAGDTEISTTSVTAIVTDDTKHTSVTNDSAIPRKSSGSTIRNASLPPPSVSGPITSSFTGNNARVSGRKYGLPPGVNVPMSIVRSKLLEAEMNSPNSKLMEVLKSLPINLINDALTEYDDAVEIKGSAAIRNHGAYLYGVVKRYVSVHERALAGEGPHILPMGEEGLTPRVQIRLEHLVTTGFCTTQEMNEKVKGKIRMLSEKDALLALDELKSVDRTSIRNFGSYFMGILNRYMRRDSTGKTRPPEANQGLPPHQQHSMQKSQMDRMRERDRFPPRDMDHQMHPSSSSSFRDRSRDHFDNRREFGNGPNAPYRTNEGVVGNINNPMFDSRQQQAQWQTHIPPQQQPMGGGYGPVGTGMPMPGMNNPMQQDRPPMHQGGMPGMQQHQANPNFSTQQQFFPHQQQPPFMQQPQQPPFVQQGAGYATNPQQSMQNAGMYQQPPIGNVMGVQQPPQQQYLGNQPMQQSYMQQPQSNPQQFVSDPMGGAQSGWQQSQQDQSQVPIDILGLADKAASAIQALNNPMGQNFGNLAGGPSGSQQQGYGSGPYGGGNPMGQGPPPHLGMQQQSHQFPLQAQQFPPNPQLGSPNQFNQQPQMGHKRTTTAAINQLPITVQYALQNLVATGILDGQPDEGIMGMIFDLPEQMALTALQKFASIDKSSMRNKMAYLAGVLRRELEKIQRR